MFLNQWLQDYKVNDQGSHLYSYQKDQIHKWNNALYTITTHSRQTGMDTMIMCDTIFNALQGEDSTILTRFESVTNIVTSYETALKINGISSRFTTLGSLSNCQIHFSNNAKINILSHSEWNSPRGLSIENLYLCDFDKIDAYLYQPMMPIFCNQYKTALLSERRSAYSHKLYAALTNQYEVEMLELTASAIMLQNMWSIANTPSAQPLPLTVQSVIDNPRFLDDDFDIFEAF